jgi:hypothetical protein
MKKGRRRLVLVALAGMIISLGFGWRYASTRSRTGLYLVKTPLKTDRLAEVQVETVEVGDRAILQDSDTGQRFIRVASRKHLFLVISCRWLAA